MLTSIEIQSKLESLLLEDNNNVIQLYGKWGVGKTHLWNSVINEIKWKKKVVKISLFEKNSIEELKEDIVLQTYSINKQLKKYGGALDITQNAVTKMLGGVSVPNVSSLLSFLKQSDFKNIIISFDDIERRNEKFSFDTFLGYVSLLKEDKKCNIVLILNYDKLNEGDKKIFDRYKEKIIDYNMILNRSSSESLVCAIGKEPKIKFVDILTEVVNELKINNIRVIKHMVKMINEISVIDFTKYNQIIMNSFMKLYLYYSFIYFHSGISNIKELLDYSMERSNFNYYKENNKQYDGKFVFKEVFEEVLSFSFDFNIFYQFRKEILYLLDEIMESHYISNTNKERLTIELQNLSDNKDLMYASEKTFDLYWSHNWDLVNGIDYYYEDILKIIKEFKGDIVRQLKIGSFFAISKLLSEYNNDEVKELEKECISNYIKWLVDISPNHQYDLIDHWTNKSPTDFLEENGYLEEYEEEKDEKMPNVDTTLISDILKKVNSYNGEYNQLDIDILNKVSSNIIKEYVKESPNNMREISTFLDKRAQFTEFEDSKKTILNSLKEIYYENNELSNKKLDKIFGNEKSKKTFDYITNTN